MASKKAAPATAPRAELPVASFDVGSTPVLHDGELYAPGSTIELTEYQAERLKGLVTVTQEGVSA